MKTANVKAAIVEDDGSESAVVFRGFVNPAQGQSVIYGPKTRGRGFKRVSSPGEAIELTRVEFEKLKAKGLAGDLLVKSLPRVTGGEPVDDGEVSITTRSTKDEIAAALEGLGVEVEDGYSKADLLELYRDETSPALGG